MPKENYLKEEKSKPKIIGDERDENLVPLTPTQTSKLMKYIVYLNFGPSFFDIINLKKKDNKEKKLIEPNENYLYKIGIKSFSFPSSSIKDEKN